MVDKVMRFGDMHPTRALGGYRQVGGDVVIVMAQDGDTIGDDVDFGNPKTKAAMIEFCVSGGQSRHTLQALVKLLEAMEKDNAERPQQRG